MPLAPDYGETEIPQEEQAVLLPAVRELLGEPLTRAAVFDLEQAFQDDVAEDLMIGVLDGEVLLDDLLTDHAVRDLHRRLYGAIWSWGGVHRRRETNVGVAPEQVAAQLRESLDGARFRWHETDDWSPHLLGVAVHADVVRIHPFVDGNGRLTRLLADLVFVAAQDVEVPEVYDWDLDKARYVEALRRYDQHRDPRDLAGMIGTRTLGE